MNALHMHQKSNAMKQKAQAIKIAAEFNNAGVVLHEWDRLNDAEILYRDAMQVIVESHAEIDDELNSLGGKRFQKLHIGWQAKLAKIQSFLVQQQAVPHGTMHESSSTVCLSYHTSTNTQHMVLLTFSQPLSIHLRECDKGEDHPNSVVVLHNAALVQIRKGENEKAMKLFEMALSLMPCGEVDANSTIAVACIAVRHNLGILYYLDGRTIKSSSMFRDAIRLGKKTLGNHSMVARVFSTIGQILVATGQMADGMDVFMEASNIFHSHTLKLQTGTFETKRATMEPLMRLDENK